MHNDKDSAIRPVRLFLAVAAALMCIATVIAACVAAYESGRELMVSLGKGLMIGGTYWVAYGVAFALLAIAMTSLVLCWDALRTRGGDLPKFRLLVMTYITAAAYCLIIWPINAASPQDQAIYSKAILMAMTLISVGAALLLLIGAVVGAAAGLAALGMWAGLYESDEENDGGYVQTCNGADISESSS